MSLLVLLIPDKDDVLDPLPLFLKDVPVKATCSENLPEYLWLVLSLLPITFAKSFLVEKYLIESNPKKYIFISSASVGNKDFGDYGDEKEEVEMIK